MTAINKLKKNLDNLFECPTGEYQFMTFDISILSHVEKVLIAAVLKNVFTSLFLVVE
jgi:hypothetical protein